MTLPGAHDPVESRLLQPEIGEKRSRVSRLELRNLQLDLRADSGGGRAGPRQERFQAGSLRRTIDISRSLFAALQLRLVQVDDDQQWFGR